MNVSQLKPSEIFKDASLLMLGGTGFLGKVCLSMLLHRFPDVGRVYVMADKHERALERVAERCAPFLVDAGLMTAEEIEILREAALLVAL